MLKCKGRVSLIHFSWFLIMLCGVALTTIGSGCTSVNFEKEQFFIRLDGNPGSSKDIFVFLDGTANDNRDATNVWRLFDQLKHHKNPQTVARYIPGVGHVNDPLDDDPIFPIFGDALGRGMQGRILAGYDFVATEYNPGDRIFIFGFSRGAHQARSLAGLLSYAGLPKELEADESLRMFKLDRILGILKEKRDEEFLSQWEHWHIGQAPPLANEIRNDKHLKLNTQPVQIEFLGVWDTVPGSSFKNYDACKEHIGGVKEQGSFLPIVSRGERYKSGSYPPIKHIAHAVSRDENRSKFTPLYLCPPITPTYTTLEEVWFPGAHADVGGGYGDNDLPNISLNWMIGLLGKSYSFLSEPHKLAENPTGLAHWSYGDEPGNRGSHCEGRVNRSDRRPPLGYKAHSSIDERMKAGIAPVLIKGNRNDRDWKYPIDCEGPGK